MLCIIIQFQFGALVLLWIFCADFGCVWIITTAHRRLFFFELFSLLELRWLSDSIYVVHDASFSFSLVRFGWESSREKIHFGRLLNWIALNCCSCWEIDAGGRDECLLLRLLLLGELDWICLFFQKFGSVRYEWTMDCGVLCWAVGDSLRFESLCLMRLMLRFKFVFQTEFVGSWIIE